MYSLHECFPYYRYSITCMSSHKKENHQEFHNNCHKTFTARTPKQHIYLKYCKSHS